MSKSKVELINTSYEILRISGLTTKASPEELTFALGQLEAMMEEFESRNICSSYNFEESPKMASDSMLEVKYQNAVEYSLAMRLATAFGKEPTSGMRMTARAALATWSADSGVTKQIRYPNRQPRGSGNTFRFSNRRRYYRQDGGAPIECTTETIKVDETNDFEWDFFRYLESGETISSYTIEASNGLDLNSNHALQGNKVLYTVKGVQSGSQYVLITITTSLGRINPQKVNFQVIDQGVTSDA